MALKNGDKVRAHYTGTLEDGTQFDSSNGREPLEFVLGEGSIIPGFEKAVLGHEPGEHVRVVIPPEEAYGMADPELVFTVKKDQIPENIPLKAGTRLMLSNEADEEAKMDVTITEVGDDDVTLDANIPLAGKTLIFDIDIL